MNLRNLVGDEKQMRVMYQKQSTSGLANWKQFQLANHPVSLRLPTEVLEAYRLTFFVDDAEPISARVEKVLAELEISTELPEENLSEDIETVTDTEFVDIPNQVDISTSEEPEVAAVKQVETTSDLSEIQPTKQALQARPKSPLESDEQFDPSHTVAQPSTIRKVKPELPNVGSHSEFKISVFVSSTKCAHITTEVADKYSTRKH